MPTGFCKATVARGGRAGRVGEFFRTPPARAFHSFKLYIHEAQAVAKFWNAFFFCSFRRPEQGGQPLRMAVAAWQAFMNFFRISQVVHSWIFPYLCLRSSFCSYRHRVACPQSPGGRNAGAGSVSNQKGRLRPPKTQTEDGSVKKGTPAADAEARTATRGTIQDRGSPLPPIGRGGGRSVSENDITENTTNGVKD